MSDTGTTEDASTSKNISKSKVSQDDQNAQNGSDTQENNFLTPELVKIHKKLNPRMRRYYDRCESNQEKIVFLNAIKLEREQGELEISSIFNVISMLIAIAITVISKYIKDEK
ncbi:19632_t:CDS:2 [Gigaspora rosea]|nr:19632_t:CDS:2 [Gigaspora rosea]